MTKIVLTRVLKRFYLKNTVIVLFLSLSAAAQQPPSLMQLLGDCVINYQQLTDIFSSCIVLSKVSGITEIPPWYVYAACSGDLVGLLAQVVICVVDIVNYRQVTSESATLFITPNSNSGPNLGPADLISLIQATLSQNETRTEFLNLLKPVLNN